MTQPLISAIVPTIGRADSLTRLLESLVKQTMRPDEIMIADGSNASAVAGVVLDPRWRNHGIVIKHIVVNPPNAVRQRKAAIAASSGDLLLLLDDDVELEPDCIEQMVGVLEQQTNVVAVTADFNNQTWSQPTSAWRWVLKVFYGIEAGEWQGRVVGPLLRFGYYPSPPSSVPMEWLGAGNSLIRRTAYESVGGFSDFFLHRCTMNEDVDLGLKLGRIGQIMLCPTARMAHWHVPSGRVSPKIAAEDDVYNRFMILHKTVGHSNLKSFMLVFCFVSIESLSNFLGSLKRRKLGISVTLLYGRIRGMMQAGRACFITRAEDAI